MECGRRTPNKAEESRQVLRTIFMLMVLQSIKIIAQITLPWQQSMLDEQEVTLHAVVVIAPVVVEVVAVALVIVEVLVAKVLVVVTG